jgi:hypothetical protein
VVPNASPILGFDLTTVLEASKKPLLADLGFQSDGIFAGGLPVSVIALVWVWYL